MAIKGKSIGLFLILTLILSATAFSDNLAKQASKQKLSSELSSDSKSSHDVKPSTLETLKQNITSVLEDKPPPGTTVTIKKKSARKIAPKPKNVAKSVIKKGLKNSKPTMKKKAIDIVSLKSFTPKIISTPITLSNKNITKNITYKNAVFKQNINYSMSNIAAITNFTDSGFHANADFASVNFRKPAVFIWTTFHKQGNFNYAYFYDDAEFYSSEFKGEGDFYGADFYKEANFVNLGTTDNTFMNFNFVSFKADVNFHSSIFKGKVSFLGSSFAGSLNFNKATFYHPADFTDVVFGSSASFKNTIFKDDLLFNRVVLPEYLNLEDAVFSKPINLLNTHPSISSDRTKINLLGTDVDKIYMDYINFELYFPKNTPYNEKNRIYQTLLKNFLQQGLADSHQRLSIEYQQFQYYSSGQYFLNFLDKYWWNYGYDKGRVFYWFLFAFVMFTFINFVFYLKLTKNISDGYFSQSGITRDAVRNNVVKMFYILPRAFILTLMVFFNPLLKYKLDELWDTQNMIRILYMTLMVSMGTGIVMFIFIYILGASS